MTSTVYETQEVISAREYARAVFNIMEDFASERDHFRDTQKAITNILDDFGGEKERLTLVQKAAMNILDDFGAEKARLEAMQRAVLNVLEDFAAEKSELERTKKAVLNILEDLGAEKSRLQESQTEILRSEEALRGSLHDKEVLLREVHHRVKNNLQLIASLLNLQARHVGEKHSRVFLEESQNRIHSIALVHETLYQSGELARVNLGDYLKTLTGYLMESWIGVSGRVRLSVDAAQLVVPVDVTIPCGLIVNEVVTNALKHAFPGERAGVVRISLRHGEPGQMILAIADDGVGMPENVDVTRAAGLGLQLVTTLARQLRGSIVVRREHGTEVEITLAVPA